MADQTDIYEKLGSFYLGRNYHPAEGEVGEEYTLYDSKDLVTHAVCVGMTGSGKTGLGITLLEEAAIDGIPAIVVDPKGDLTNLLLNFPNLQPADFAPWINADDAARSGKTVEEYAAAQAELWRGGLEKWDQSGNRVGKLHDSCEFNIYTPGSDAGIPISIVSSFSAPSKAVMDDSDLLSDRISTTATSLLALLKIDADPLRSREHILLTTILNHCWQSGQGMTLGTLIQMVQQPPVQKIGVMDIESFFPAKDRFELAMSLNNLLAAPGFQSWMTGVPLDVNQLLYTPQGRPKISIVYTAHLSETERMFFLSLLLNEIISWMRSRPGTTSLRAILYIDEIYGYMPPVANPPSKRPLLTLLKQARAFGLGLVLATQNPVDLDYKGLSNAGTWFLGRLQTDRDKQRVLDGLEGASQESGAGFNRQQIGDLLSGLGKRVFLLHNVHDSHPVLFQTRWALSYLAGPLTRTQIKRLMEGRKNQVIAATTGHRAPAGSEDGTDSVPSPQQNADLVASPPLSAAQTQPPVLPPDVPQVYIPMRQAVAAGQLTYRPHLLAVAKVHFVDSRKGLSANEELTLRASLDNFAFGIAWDDAEDLGIDPNDLTDKPPATGKHAEVPSEATQGKSYRSWEKSLADHLYRTRRFTLYACNHLDAVSEPGESERDFRIRLADRAREERDEQVEKLRDKYRSKLQTLEERVRKAEVRIEKEEKEASGAKMQTAISFGATILSAVLGRRAISATSIGRATSAARGFGQSARQADDVQRAEQDLESYAERLEAVQRELERDIEEIEDKLNPQSIPMDTITLKPRRTDINVRTVALAWAPYGLAADGNQMEAW